MYSDIKVTMNVVPRAKVWPAPKPVPKDIPPAEWHPARNMQDVFNRDMNVEEWLRFASKVLYVQA